MQNDIKANNVLLKLKEGNWIPKLTGKGKITLNSETEVYRLSVSQTEKYNKKYPHLAYELRNVFAAKTSFASDVYSRGYIFEYLAINISYQISFSKKMVKKPSHRVEIIYVVNTLRKAVNKKCAFCLIFCLILMNVLNFKIEFKNFTDFKNVRISKIFLR